MTTTLGKKEENRDSGPLSGNAATKPARVSPEPRRRKAPLSDVGDSALLDALLLAAADAIIVSDGSGTITRASAAAADLFGHAEADLLGQNVRILMPPDVAAVHDDHMKRYLATGEAHIIGAGRDVEGRHNSGRTIPLRLSIGETRIDGEPVFVAILHDLSRAHQDRDAMLRAQRMDAIGQMTGGIAHDFNNLLTVIIGNLELLEGIDLPAHADPLIRDALEAAELGEDLTSRLLVFARKSALRPVPTDLAEVVDVSVRLLRRAISPQCRISCAVAKGTWLAQIDPTQLQTSILNLVLNAQDAMPGGGEIAISVRNEEIGSTLPGEESDLNPGRYVILTVSDSGDGMDDNIRARALEPFFTTKPPGKGTGLGLSMVYGFVKQSGGHVVIDSRPGEGTTVKLYLPAMDAGDYARAGVSGREIPSRAKGRGELILIVEDDPRIRRLTETRIASFGYDCLSAVDAQEAWELLSTRDDIDLVFSDLVMPGEMTGYDLARRVAASYPDVRTLLTSGFSEALLQDRDVGQDFPVLGKPYRARDLFEAIRNVLDSG